MKARGITKNVPFLNLEYLYYEFANIWWEKKRIINLYFNQHKTYAEIAEIMKISPHDMHIIIKEEEARRQKHKQQELSAESYKLFSEGKAPVEVAIILNLREPEVTKLYREYWKLRWLDILNLIYKETNGKIWIVLKLYKELVKKRHMSIEQVRNAVDIAIHKLPYMESLYNQLKDEVDKLQNTIQGLIKNIDALKYKISILDKTAFACEQDCKRTEQQLQELIDKKNRIEKLIANIMNNDNEGYSKLKQIVKENVKAILSDNKIVISTAFAALVQTLQNDPEMIKTIYNIPSANDGEQHKDNNSIIQYLESNKDRILDFTEKNYENLVEAFTKNAVDTTADTSFSSNPIYSLPSSSSSTFSPPSDQSDTYRIEDQESFRLNKDDSNDW
jgi:hypothetical protein